MANLIQQPQQYNFAGNLVDIVLMSDIPVSFSLAGLLDEVYYPYSEGRVTIPLRAFFEAHLHAPDLNDIPDSGLPLVPYTFSIDGKEAGTFHVLPGGVVNKALDTEMFLRSNFLTWQPQTRYVSYHEPHWLRYVALQAATVKVKAYFAEDEPQTITLKELASGHLYDIDLNYGRIRGLFEKQPTYYDVWVETADGERLSFVQRYVLRENAADTVDFFVFENSLGGFDTIRFTGDRKEIAESESRNAVFDGNTNEYSVDYSKAWLKQTGYIPDERTRLWVLDFFSSCRRYHLSVDSLNRIFMSKPKLEATSGEAAGYEFTFAYSEQSKYLNIARDELPEQLEIVGPGEQLFFLTPRLNEFPLLDPSQDVLIPAQMAYSQRWGVIPASALGGKGGNGDTVTGTAPIRVDRAGSIVRVSHDESTRPDPDLYNRYGNVDKWGHIVSDYHPHGGRADHDFAAQDITSRAAILSGEVKNPDYVPGTFGNTWGGTPAGDFWFKTLGARDGITTTEMIYNRQSVEGNIKYFTDGIAVAGVSDVARLTDSAGRPLTTNNNVQMVISIGPGMYHIIPKALDDDGRTPFSPDDILIGYFRQDNSLLPTATYLRVVSVFGAGEGFTARLLQGGPPQQHMILARRGNFTNPARQNSVYVDGKAGKMVFLRGVNGTNILPYNVAAQIGYIGDVVDPAFPDITPEEIGLYTQNIRAKGDFCLRNGKNVAGEFERVETSFTAVNGKIEGVVSSVQTLDGRVTQEVSALTQTASEISLSVSNLSTSVNGRINTAESRITVNEQGILNRVEKNGVISSINQSAEEVKIEANKIRLIGETTLDGIINLNGTVKADFIDVDNLTVRKLRTKDTGTRIEIDDQSQKIRAVDYRDSEVFTLTGLNKDEMPSMIFNSGYGDCSRVTKEGFYICKGSENPYSSATAMLLDRFVVVKLPGGVDMGKMGCAEGHAFLQLNAPKSIVSFAGLQSTAGFDGDWAPLYFDKKTGEVRFG